MSLGVAVYSYFSTPTAPPRPRRCILPFRAAAASPAALDRRRRPQNVAGDFFVGEQSKIQLLSFPPTARALPDCRAVFAFSRFQPPRRRRADHRCIDCQTCRWMAPVSSFLPSHPCITSFSFSRLAMAKTTIACRHAGGVQEGGWQGRRSGAAQLRGGEDQGPAGVCVCDYM
jgi:hypothetical protein